MVYLLVSGILMAEVTAMNFLKQYAMTSKATYLFIGIICYGIVATLLARSFRYDDMAVVNVMWTSSSMVLILLLGVIFYKEHINIAESLGILLVVAGVSVLRLYAA